MGRGVVRAAAAAGADVVAAGRRSARERAAVAPGPGRVEEAAVDVTDEASVRALFERQAALDHLVVTAAPPPGSWKPFMEQDLADARRYFDAKLFGAWACARYAAPLMPAGGSITFLTGAAAVRPARGAAVVTASFAAVEALSRALALELGPLRVNTLRPGYTDSEMWGFLDGAARADLRRRVAEAMPVRRIGTVEDIAHAALFLMTSAQTTGAVLEVSGGETLVDALG
jgi:NAD(P)-dependent dehydrogenase (short-subunit alcohol dehydrogenase family)